MTKHFRKTLELWKVLWVVCPLTYLVALALFALAGLVADKATGKTTVHIGGQAVVMATNEWFRYAWYQTVAVQFIAFAHAAFCVFLVLRYRHNTTHTWFKIFAVTLVFVYLGYVGYCAYGLFHPDPRFKPIVDPF
jgi:hypothetical protein